MALCTAVSDTQTKISYISFHTKSQISRELLKGTWEWQWELLQSVIELQISQSLILNHVTIVSSN